jgi:aconitate hydratase
MDARSIAATAMRGGRLTAATELDLHYGTPVYFFDREIYKKRVYDGRGRARPQEELVLGPNIKDWPAQSALPENLLVKIVSFITDPVTTTDELIPSGETSSYRSNPLRLAEFTLSRKDPLYVEKAKAVKELEEERRRGRPGKELEALLEKIQALPELPGLSTQPSSGSLSLESLGIGSAIYARKPGDGSAREQAASCQRVLGAAANFALEYATKRYRSNLINWGILPFIIKDENLLRPGDYVFFPMIKKAVLEKAPSLTGFILGEPPAPIQAALGELSGSERQILLDGCLINHYAAGANKT